VKEELDEFLGQQREKRWKEYARWIRQNKMFPMKNSLFKVF